MQLQRSTMSDMIEVITRAPHHKEYALRHGAIESNDDESGASSSNEIENPRSVCDRN